MEHNDDFLKKTIGDRKPETYFTNPGDAYFEGLSSSVHHRIREANAGKTRGFSWLTPARVSLVGISMAAILMLLFNTETPIPNPDMSFEDDDEEIYTDVISEEMDLDNDLSIIIPASAPADEESTEDELDHMDEEDLEELYNDLNT